MTLPHVVAVDMIDRPPTTPSSSPPPTASKTATLGDSHDSQRGRHLTSGSEGARSEIGAVLEVETVTTRCAEVCVARARPRGRRRLDHDSHDRRQSGLASAHRAPAGAFELHSLGTRVCCSGKAQGPAVAPCPPAAFKRSARHVQRLARGKGPQAHRPAGRRLFRDRRLRGQTLPKPTGYRDAVPAGTSVTWKTHWNALRYRKRIDAGTRSKPSGFGGASPACIEVIQMTALSEAVGLHDGCRLSEAGYLGQVLTLTSALTAAGMGSTFQRTISFSTAGSPPSLARRLARALGRDLVNAATEVNAAALDFPAARMRVSAGIRAGPARKAAPAAASCGPRASTAAGPGHWSRTRRRRP